MQKRPTILKMTQSEKKMGFSKKRGSTFLSDLVQSGIDSAIFTNARKVKITVFFGPFNKLVAEFALAREIRRRKIFILTKSQNFAFFPPSLKYTNKYSNKHILTIPLTF